MGKFPTFGNNILGKWGNILGFCEIWFPVKFTNSIPKVVSLVLVTQNKDDLLHKSCDLLLKLCVRHVHKQSTLVHSQSCLHNRSALTNSYYDCILCFSFFSMDNSNYCNVKMNGLIATTEGWYSVASLTSQIYLALST